MIKNDIVRKLSESPICFRISQKQLRQIVTEVLNVMTEALLNREDIILRGFGHFRVKYRAPRVINHPSTKQRIMSPPKYMIFFDPAKNIKQQMRLGESASIPIDDDDNEG